MSPIRLRKFRNQPITAARFVRSVKHHFAENISVPHHVKPRQVHAILNDILEPLPGISEETSEVEYSHSERFVCNALSMLAGLRVLKLYPWVLSSVYIFGYFLISRREKDRICMEAYDCIRKGENLTTTIIQHVVNSVIFSYDDKNREVLTKNDIENFRRTLLRDCCKKELQVLAEWPKGLGFMCSSDEYGNMEDEMRHYFKLFEMNNSILSDSIEDNCKSISSKPSQHIDRNIGNCSSENDNEVEVEEIYSMSPQHQSYNNLNFISIRLNIEESKRNNNLRAKRYKYETLKKLDAVKNKKKNTRKKLKKKIKKKVLLLKADIKSIADKSNNFKNKHKEESSLNENNLRLKNNTNNELHKVKMLERRNKNKMIIKDQIADRTRSKNQISLKKLDTVDQEPKDKSGEVIENSNVDEFTCKRVIPFVGKTVRKPLYGGPERPIQVDCSVSDTICSSECLNNKLPGLSSEAKLIAQTSNNREQESTSSQDAERQVDVLSHNMCTKLASYKNVNGQLSSSSCTNNTEHLKKASLKLIGNNMYTNKRKLNAHLEKNNINVIEINDVVTSDSGIAAPAMSKEKQNNHIAINQNSANVVANQNTFQIDHLIGQPEDQSNVKRKHLNSRSNSPLVVSTIPLANTSSNFTAQDNDSASSSKKMYSTVLNTEVEIVEIIKSNTSSKSIPEIKTPNDTASAHTFASDPLKILNANLSENSNDKTAATMNKVTMLSTQASLTEINKVNPVDQVNPPQIHQNRLHHQPQLCSATSYNNVKNNTDSSNVNNTTLNFRSNILQHTVSNCLDRRRQPPPYPSLAIASNRPSSSQGNYLPPNPPVKVCPKKSRTKPRILRNVRISSLQQSNIQFNTKRYFSHLSDVRHSSLANVTLTSSNCLQSQEQQQSVSQGKPHQNHHLHQQIQRQQQQQCNRTNEVVTLVPNDRQTSVNPKKCYVCDYCPDHLIFESEGLLRKHMDVAHNYFCELCKNRYPSLQELLQHVGVHLGIHTCEISDIVIT